MYYRVDSGPGLGGGGVIPYQFTSEEMGNSHLQFEACRILINVLIDYLEHQSQGLRLYRVGSELAMHLDPADLGKKVTPDCYIMEDEPQAGPKLPSWKPWEHDGKMPTLAVEVVSDSYAKDYNPEEGLQRYEALGVPELVRYDPEYALHRRGKYPRRLFGHFVRDARGRLQELETHDTCLQLRGYPVWLVHRPPYYLRLATGAAIDDLVLWPTAAERAKVESERARTEAERAAVAIERANAAQERADRAEAELARLRAELERLTAR